jgi:beta-glucosidase
LVGDYAYASMADVMDGGPQPPDKTRFHDKLPPMLSVLAAIRQHVGAAKTSVRYEQGCDYKAASREGFAAAIDLARTSDVVILVVGGRSGQMDICTGGELRDSATLNLPGVQSELVAEVARAAAGKPVVLVLVDGRPFAIPELVAQVPAVLEAWLPGEEGGPAVADVLFGTVNPGGKLPITVPRSSGQVPIYYRHKPSAGKSYNFNDYVEESAKPLFPFGHGLSYTRFEYSALEVSPERVPPDGEVKIKATVTNTGARAGDEVVQLYLHDVVSSVTRPVQELKGFKRVSLRPNESATVTFTVPVALMAFYDRSMHFVVDPGQIDVQIGSSSADIRLTGQFHIVGAVTRVPYKVFFSRSEVETMPAATGEPA